MLIWHGLMLRIDLPVHESFEGGILFTGETNVWISSDGTYVRMLLTQDIEIFNQISTQINNF
jgi:hypothetical protein